MALLSGEMQVEQRAAVIDRFRDGKEKVLVTTNVCARGEEENPVSTCFYPPKVLFMIYFYLFMSEYLN